MKSKKEQSLKYRAKQVKQLYKSPRLRQLVLELTLRCNEHCFHCGSSCTPQEEEGLSLQEYHLILDQVKQDFDIREIQLCITGGEPLLRRDFFEILGYARQLGFHWGMTSNGTLITKEIAHRLAQCGMGTVSISIDGLKETHDRLRGFPGGYELAMQGIQNLIDERAFQVIQVTTVVNHENISELDALLDIMCELEIDSWRVINLEPIGRALEHPEMMCTEEDYKRLFRFIKEKREAGYPVEYGCSHYLGPAYEGELRNWYWMCSSGLYLASIMANGDIGGCLDIERRPELIQGNIRKDRLLDVWENRFEIYRRDLSENSEYCSGCKHAKYCRGDGHHSWDYNRNEPRVCFKGLLF